MVEVELNKDFNLLEKDKKVLLHLPRARFPLEMDIDLEWGRMEDVRQDLGEGVVNYEPILVPGDPAWSYQCDSADTTLLGLRRKMRKLGLRTIRKWPEIYAKTQNVLVSKEELYQGVLVSELLKIGDPDDLLPFPIDEYMENLQRLFFTVKLRGSSYTSPNTDKESFAFQFFKPTEIATLQPRSLNSLIYFQVKKGVIISYNTDGFPLCLTPDDIDSQYIPAQFSMV